MFGSQGKEAEEKEKKILVEIQKKMFENLHKNAENPSEKIENLNDPWSWIYGKHLANLAVTGNVSNASNLLREIKERMDVKKMMNERVGVGARTPLHIACDLGHENFVNFLLENGSEVNCRDENGCTPLWYAASNGYEDIVRILLDSDANVDLRGKFSFHEFKNKTPREVAKEKGHFDIEKILRRKERKLSAKWELQKRESEKNLKVLMDKQKKEREESEKMKREEKELAIRKERLKIQREEEMKQAEVLLLEKEKEKKVEEPINKQNSYGFFSRYLWGSSMTALRENPSGVHPRES
eukprot:TRINITY_DN3526_c0_g1_i1.p2 TRINITY_DN3526_c0_g1~~TRINITY_DN3526_c0_g1_i1.p2  ORF type:complete len:297 (-),score=122.91 TRINITY_DN3526_c0_g1_i1:81-971(-)